MEQTNSIKLKVVDSLFKLIFDNNGIICGSPIREYVLPSINDKVCPLEFYIYNESSFQSFGSSNDIEHFYKSIYQVLNFCFDVRTEKYHKNIDMYLQYKFNHDI